jgi:hypothetical protein
MFEAALSRLLASKAPGACSMTGLCTGSGIYEPRRSLARGCCAVLKMKDSRRLQTTCQCHHVPGMA